MAVPFRGAAVGLAMLGVLGVAGCDRGPGIALVNGLDQPVILHLTSPYGRRPADVVLRPGRAKAFDGRNAKEGVYSVTVGGCELVYGFPKIDGGFNYAWYLPDRKGGGAPDYRYPYPVAQVLRSDDRLYLARSLSGKPAADQVHGFPLSPISKTCPNS